MLYILTRHPHNFTQLSMNSEVPKKSRAVVTPASVEEERNSNSKFLEDNHSVIPSHVKTLAWTWIYKKSHDFCKYTPVNEIPDVLCKFDIECTKDGREFRCPVLKKIGGIDTPVFEFMEFQSSCRVHWSCELCGLPLCINPRAYVAKEVLPCTPVKSRELTKVPESWSAADYLFYYLLKKHVDLEMDDIDTKNMKNHFRNWDFGGRAESTFWKEVRSYKNSHEIFEILRNSLDLLEE